MSPDTCLLGSGVAALGGEKGQTINPAGVDSTLFYTQFGISPRAYTRLALH